MANTPTFDLDAFGNVPMNWHGPSSLAEPPARRAMCWSANNEDDGGHIVVRHGYVPPRDWRRGSRHAR